MLERHNPGPPHAVGGYDPRSLAEYRGEEPYYAVPYGYGLAGIDVEEPFDPLKLLLYVVQYRWLIGTLLVMGAVVGVMVTLMQTPKFKASASLEVQAPSAKVFQDLQAVSQVDDMRAYVTAQEELKTRSLAERVVHALDLSQNPTFLFPAPGFSISNLFDRAFGIKLTKSLDDFDPEMRDRMAVNRVLGGLSVDLVRNTSLLSISFIDEDPKLARDVANQVAQSFIDQKVDQNVTTSGLARQFIQEQVAQIKQKLQDSERALVDYAKEQDLTTTGEHDSLVTSNINAINTALSTAIQERLDNERIVGQIDAGNGPQLPQVLQNEAIQNLKQQIAGLEGDYQQKLGQFKPDYPEMVKLKAQIVEMQRQVKALTQSILNSLKIKYQDAASKETDLRSKLSELQKQQVEYQDKNIKPTILKREVDSHRKQYDSLIDKPNFVGVSSELKDPTAQIVDRAVLPQHRYSPRLSVDLAIALALSLGLAGAIIYIVELLNNSFAHPEQIESELKLPVLGIVPATDPQELQNAISDQKSALSEAYRSLRTSLQFVGTEGAPKTLLVTSSEPSEGKSTTAMKVAQDFAVLGARVLLIDADMRKPSLHRLLGIDNALGLSNLLTNTARQADLPKILRQTKLPNVTVMTAGTLPPNPADLLMSQKMGLILNALSQKYDMIVFDSPPIIGLSDAPILARLVEATLMVVSAHQVTRKSAQAAMKRLRLAGANVVGAALVKFELDRFEYKYAYRYMNYNYYTYGEGTKALESANDDDASERPEGQSWLAHLSGYVGRLGGYRPGRRKSSA